MWRKISVNDNNIKAETEKAVLIACPHNSDFDGYVFWHPQKLVRQRKKSSVREISYTEDFTFRLKKYGKGKHNSREVLSEVEVSYEEIEDIFGSTNENLQIANPYETHKPEELVAVKAEADESLIDEGDLPF